MSSEENRCMYSCVRIICVFTFSKNDVDRLVTEYPNDLKRHLEHEILQIKIIFVESKSQFELLRSISELGIKSTFPNIYVALKIIRILPVTNFEGERQFSALARIKNKLRSSMSQMKLNSLELLSIESEFVKTIDFSDIIDYFAKRKSRKAAVA